MILVFALFCLIGAATVQAATYYVATTGDDANAGILENVPFKTIRKGVSMLTPGDTLLIRAGTYAEAIRTSAQRLPSGTSWSNAPVIAGYPGETVILKPTSGLDIISIQSSSGVRFLHFKDLIFDGDSLSKSPDFSANVIAMSRSSLPLLPEHIRFENVEVRNSPYNGVQAGGSDIQFINVYVHTNGAYANSIGDPQGANGMYLFVSNSLIDGGVFYNNDCFGIRSYHSGAPTAQNVTIRNARLFQNGRTKGLSGAANCGSGGGGIFLGDASMYVYNNLVYNNFWGIQTNHFEANTDARIENNTLYNNSFHIQIGGASKGAFLRNNIIAGTGSPIIDNRAGGNVTIANNLCQTTDAECAIVADPLLMNPGTSGGSDFRLRAGSPAIDRGTTISAIKNDFNNLARPQGAAYNIGAYESSGTTGNVSLAPPQNLRIF